MTLIEEIEESIRLGDVYGNNTNLAEVLSEAGVLLKKIKESQERIIILFQDASNMRDAGLITDEGISDILDLLSEIYEDVSKNDYKSYKLEIVLKNSNRARNDIDDIWDRYVKREISTQRDIVETLHILMTESQRYITLSNLYNRIKSNACPGNKSIMKDIETYKTLTEKMINELDLKEPILRFFERMAEKKVLSLRDMTPEIWDWIHKNHFEDKFTIKISANSY